MRSRLLKLVSGHKLETTPPVYCLAHSLWDLNADNDIDNLQYFIDLCKAGLVVVDALADVIPGTDENSAREIALFFRKIRRVVLNTEAAIIFIHHANKRGIYRGSTFLKGIVDSMIYIESQPTSDLLQITTLKQRDSTGRRIAARLMITDDNSADEARLELADNMESELLTLRNPTIAHILRFLQNNGPTRSKDLFENRGTFGKGAISKAIRTLREEGIIFRTNEGGRGVPAIYAIRSQQ